jgi:hypothetical protein
LATAFGPRWWFLVCSPVQRDQAGKVSRFVRTIADRVAEWFIPAFLLVSLLS